MTFCQPKLRMLCEICSATSSSPNLKCHLGVSDAGKTRGGSSDSGVLTNDVVGLVVGCVVADASIRRCRYSAGTTSLPPMVVFTSDA